MVKQLITDISEQDFRKLDITVAVHEKVDLGEGHIKYAFVPKKLNDILDSEINAMIGGGEEENLKYFDIPITVAIHESNDKNVEDLSMMDVFFDKFMNRFTPAQTYYLAWGIKHLYSTRDYYEDREDYWKVRKSETKVIYRIHLDPKWKESFIVKHRKEVLDWPYNELPDGVSPDYDKAVLEIYYDKDENNEWKEIGRAGLFTKGRMCHILPVDKEGKAKRK